MALIPDLAEGVILLDHQYMPRANLRAFGGAMGVEQPTRCGVNRS
jgi:hypothetical protein